MPVVNADPHLVAVSVNSRIKNLEAHTAHREASQQGSQLTFLNVLSPAKILPPIQVEYFLSGGAKIFMRMSLTASLCTSVSRRSPKPLVSVLPPDSTMLE